MTSKPNRTVLLRHGTVHSPADPFATAMLVDGDTVAWVGADDAAASYADAADEVVDLDGALVTPAFVDAHMHTTGTGQALTGLDLTGSPSLANALDRLAEHVRNTPADTVVLGHGWDESGWPEGRPPSRAELDRAGGGRPVYLARTDAHSAVCSTALLSAVDGLSGRPGYGTGELLTGDAHHAVRTHTDAALTDAQRERFQRAALDHAAALGIGTVHECGGPYLGGEHDLQQLLDLAETGDTIRVLGYWGDTGPDAVDTAKRLGALGAGGDLFADGSLGSRTAHLRAPYADAPERTGSQKLTVEQIAEHVTACTRAGLQAGFHAIGDAALDTLTAGFRRAAEDVGLPALRAARHRVEHAEMADDAHLADFVDLGLVASVQPGFDAAWGGPGGMYERRLGAERAAAMNPFAAMARAGVPLALGSDAPVTPLGGWAAVRAAAFHSNAEHRISARAAFAAHTRGGWRAAGRDGGGVLAPGAPADYALWDSGELVVQVPDERVANWSTDPRSGTPGLPDLEPGRPLPRCLRTVVAGRTVFAAG